MNAQTLPYVEHLVQREDILNERITGIKERVRDQPVYGDWERDHLLTEYWRQSDSEPIYLRRAGAFDKIMTEMTIKIFDGELIVGGPNQFGVGGAFYPEFHQEWIEKEWDKFSRREADRFAPVGEREEVLNDCKFWKGKSLLDVTMPLWQREYGTLMQDLIETRCSVDVRPMTEGRQIVDFIKVLNKGLAGVIEEAKEMKDKLAIKTSDDLRKFEFWESCVIACNAVIKFANRHAKLSRKMAEKETDQVRKKELEEIARVCSRVPENPARTFTEALQSIWFTHLCVEIENNSFGYSLGRMDQYLYPFYKEDLEKGKVTREEAAELLACLWLKFSTIYWLTRGAVVAFSQTSNFQNITIGGRDKNGQDVTNELTHLIVEVDTALKLRQPTVSLRYHDRVNENILFKCGEDIATGGGKPAIFCEKYPYSVLPLYGVPLEEVVEFAPIGCVEFGIPGKTTLLGGSFVSVPHCLELVFTNGIHLKTGKKIGIETGDVEGLKTFDQLMNAVLKQFKHVYHIILNCIQMWEGPIQAARTPLPFNSSIISDCIAAGKDIYSGGGRYKQFYICAPFGMVTLANSLYAVKKLVYEEQQITITELKGALAANFSGNGYDRIRKLCLNVPKYGNDLNEVDCIHRDLFVKCSEIISREKSTFGYPVAPAYLGISTHYWHGPGCGATPDGRLAYTVFADGSLSAAPGTDTHGPTALIKSATKANLAPALGNIFNMKFHPSVFEKPEGMRSFWDMVKTYSDLGGYHIQFNVVDRQTLLNAKARPEEYRDLLVRVAGFSAYFADLSPAVQDEIIARTEHVF